MQKDEKIFIENIRVLEQKNPVLAGKILEAELSGSYEILYSRSGKPVVKSGNITFHSLYDPVHEARQMIELSVNNGQLSSGQEIIVFGLGFAYHINAMVEQSVCGVIYEPRLEIIRLAMENIDLRPIFIKMNIYTDIEDLLPGIKKHLLWSHQPSANHSREAFKDFQKIRNDKSTSTHLLRGRKKERLKILVVSPVYGGSLPVSRNCYRAFKMLGHDVHFWDASIFKVPFEKALDLKINNRNKKVLHDLFLHLISEMVVATCSEFSPDIVFAVAQTPLSRKALERFREKNITTAFWFVEDFQLMKYWKEYAPLYDLFFCIQKDGLIKEAIKTGAENISYLPLAADPEIHCPVKLGSHEKNEFGSMLSFMGAGYYNRQKFFMGLLDYDFKIWGSDWPEENYLLYRKVQKCGQRLSTEETVKVFNASIVNLNLHSSVCHEGIDPFGDFINPRTFEIASCGAFQLVDQRKLLEEHFEPGREITCFSGIEDLRQLVNYYSKHDNERKQISNNARKRVMAHHTYKHRMKRVLEFAMERKPGCFYHKAGDKNLISSDISAFTERFPEIEDVLRLAGNKGIADLDNVLSVIKEKQSPLEYHEAIFILLKNFQDLISEQPLC